MTCEPPIATTTSCETLPKSSAAVWFAWPVEMEDIVVFATASCSRSKRRCICGSIAITLTV